MRALRPIGLLVVLQVALAAIWTMHTTVHRALSMETYAWGAWHRISSDAPWLQVPLLAVAIAAGHALVRRRRAYLPAVLALATALLSLGALRLHHLAPVQSHGSAANPYVASLLVLLGAGVSLLILEPLLVATRRPPCNTPVARVAARKPPA